MGPADSKFIKKALFNSDEYKSVLPDVVQKQGRLSVSRPACYAVDFVEGIAVCKEHSNNSMAIPTRQTTQLPQTALLSWSSAAEKSAQFVFTTRTLGQRKGGAHAPPSHNQSLSWRGPGPGRSYQFMRVWTGYGGGPAPGGLGPPQ